ncbi:transmembrane protein 199 [Odontomachus brunneus]|uniref:transmembrane protein 199 n=1 Tax=Odontomachus brunneus TaxID=486640 RepID=UPI0013F1859F|nr:transmembrane protein 199 [Odontomachus brunneus]
MPIESITDPTIRIKSAKLTDFIMKNVGESDNAPIGIISLIQSKESKMKIANATLKLEDLMWLNKYLKDNRETGMEKIYLHNLLDISDVILPSPEVTARNPELEARMKKLRAQENTRKYQAMTKNIDSVRKFLPEDSIAYQMKQLNKQLIAVAQFIFSVMAGFAFGFIGVELLIGDLDFGFRLLLGIICALIIALAEFYFLALKLNELDNFEISVNLLNVNVKTKLHQD